MVSVCWHKTDFFSLDLFGSRGETTHPLSDKGSEGREPVRQPSEKEKKGGFLPVVLISRRGKQG